MNQPVNTRSYDLFKAIVALILLILLIWLLLRGATPSAPVAVAPAAANTPTSAPQVNPTVQPTATSRPVQPGTTPTVEPTETSLPTPTPAVALATEQPPTESPSATPQPTAASSATEAPSVASGQIPVDCPLALPARLKVGDTAQVTSNLNMRSAAGIGNQLILTNPTVTQLTIIGGPVCEPYQGGAYLWWQVRRSDEQSGWSAEGSSTGKIYFLEPIK